MPTTLHLATRNTPATQLTDRSLTHFGGYFIDNITKGTLARIPTFVAGDAAVNVFMTDVNPLSFNALRVQSPFHLVQRHRRIAIGLRASIKNDYFHLPFFCRFDAQF